MCSSDLETPVGSTRHFQVEEGRPLHPGVPEVLPRKGDHRRRVPRPHGGGGKGGEGWSRSEGIRGIPLPAACQGDEPRQQDPEGLPGPPSQPQPPASFLSLAFLFFSFLGRLFPKLPRKRFPFRVFLSPFPMASIPRRPSSLRLPDPLFRLPGRPGESRPFGFSLPGAGSGPGEE